jgi:hypothetical protein
MTMTVIVGPDSDEWMDLAAVTTGTFSQVTGTLDPRGGRHHAGSCEGLRPSNG